MQITEELARTGGFASMARELGVSEEQATRGAEALLPSILGEMEKQADDGDGGDGLGSLLNRFGGGGLMDQVLSPQATETSRGNDILGQLFGSKDGSRAVASNAAAKSGIDTGTLKKMLPRLAMLVTGYMARQQGAGGTAAPGGGGLGGLLGGLAGKLDRNGDGNPLDDILGGRGR